MSQRNEAGTDDKQHSWQSGENENTGQTKRPQDSRAPNINLTGGKAHVIQGGKPRFLYSSLSSGLQGPSRVSGCFQLCNAFPFYVR